MLWLDQLPLHGLDAAYVELLAAARAPTASNEDRVAAFPLFDRQVTYERPAGALLVKPTPTLQPSRGLRIEALRVAAAIALPAQMGTPNALQQHATALGRTRADELLPGRRRQQRRWQRWRCRPPTPPPAGAHVGRRRRRVRVLRPTPPPTTLPACGAAGWRTDAPALDRGRGGGWRRQRGWPRTPFFTSGSSDTAANPTSCQRVCPSPWRCSVRGSAPCPSRCCRCSTRRFPSTPSSPHSPPRRSQTSPKVVEGLAPSADQRSRRAARLRAASKRCAVRRGQRPGGGSIAPASPTWPTVRGGRGAR